METSYKNLLKDFSVSIEIDRPMSDYDFKIKRKHPNQYDDSGKLTHKGIEYTENIVGRRYLNIYRDLSDEFLKMDSAHQPALLIKIIDNLSEYELRPTIQYSDYEHMMDRKTYQKAINKFIELNILARIKGRNKYRINPFKILKGNVINFFKTCKEYDKLIDSGKEIDPDDFFTPERIRDIMKQH